MGEHRITAVDHVGIAVADLDEAIAWYATTFGLVATHTRDERGAGRPGGDAVRPRRRAVRRSSCWPRCGRTRRSAGSSTAAGRASSRWPTGWPTSTRAAPPCATQGVRLLYDEPRRGTAGSRINFVHPRDAGGVLVELVEPAADPPPLSWVYCLSSGADGIAPDTDQRLPYCAVTFGIPRNVTRAGGQLCRRSSTPFSPMSTTRSAVSPFPTTTAASPCTPTRPTCSPASRPATRTRARACTSTRCRPRSWHRARRSSR